MRPRLAGAAAALVVVGASCAAAPGEAPRDDATPIVPDDLTVMALPGGSGVLELIALTLQPGESGPELLAAVKNTGDTPACDAALAVELFDRRQQPLAAGIGGLLVQRFYRLEADPERIAGCVGPGDIAMASVLDVRSDLAIEDVGFVVYRCPYFALDVSPTDGLTIRRVKPRSDAAGTSYTGELINDFDVALRGPSVRVFPVDRAGRPLGMATGRAEIELPPGGRWSFETDRVDARSADYAVYPAGALADAASAR